MTSKRTQDSANQLAKSRGLIPLEPYKNANTKWKCLCKKCKSIVYPRLSHLRDGGSGCRKCGLARGANKLRLSAAKATELLLEHGFTPLTKYPGSHSRWKVMCNECKSVCYPKLNQLTTGKSGGCANCGQRSRIKKSRLDSREAKRRIIGLGFEPIDEFVSTTKLWRVRHIKCNSVVSIRLNTLTSMGAGCPACAGKQVIEGFNDLATTHPVIAKSLMDMDPKSVVSGSNKYGMWMCEAGHQWQTKIVTRTSKNSKCPYCSHRRVLRGFNDLETLHPEIASEAFGWDPGTVMPYSITRRKWRCREGHHWTTSPGNRTNGSGCPKCSEYGFISDLPGFLYLLNHDGWNMMQIGITNYPNQRLGKHKRLGWELIDLLGPMSGQRARDLETNLLRKLKQRGVISKSLSSESKFDGYSESWDYNKLRVKNLLELMELLELKYSIES